MTEPKPYNLHYPEEWERLFADTLNAVHGVHVKTTRIEYIQDAWKSITKRAVRPPRGIYKSDAWKAGHNENW